MIGRLAEHTSGLVARVVEMRAEGLLMRVVEPPTGPGSWALPIGGEFVLQLPSDPTARMAAAVALAADWSLVND